MVNQSLAPIIISLAAILMAATADPAGPPKPTDNEVAWSKYLADEYGGEAEHVCIDGSRVDILTDTFAYEVEWANKWKESIGQAVLYGILTERSPAVVLLRRGNDDKEHVLRCTMVCRQLKIMLLVYDVNAAEHQTDGKIRSTPRTVRAWMPADGPRPADMPPMRNSGREFDGGPPFGNGSWAEWDEDEGRWVRMGG